MKITEVEAFLKTEGYTGFELLDECEYLESSILMYQGRWTVQLLDVLADEDGHVFGLYYDRPATEMQEGSESGEVEIVPVTPVTSWDIVRT